MAGSSHCFATGSVTAGWGLGAGPGKMVAFQGRCWTSTQKKNRHGRRAGALRTVNQSAMNQWAPTTTMLGTPSARYISSRRAGGRVEERARRGREDTRTGGDGQAEAEHSGVSMPAMGQTEGGPDGWESAETEPVGGGRPAQTSTRPSSRHMMPCALPRPRDRLLQ